MIEMCEPEEKILWLEKKPCLGQKEKRFLRFEKKQLEPHLQSFVQEQLRLKPKTIPQLR